MYHLSDKDDDRYDFMVTGEGEFQAIRKNEDCKHVLCPHCNYCIECKRIIKHWYIFNPKTTGEQIE